MTLRKTVVVHAGGIGDLLLTLAAMQPLSNSHDFTWVGNPDRLALATMAGLADAVVDGDRTGLATLFSTPDPVARAFYARFDEALVWMRDDGQVASALRECGVPVVHCFPGLPPENWTRHASAYYAECLDLPAPESLRLKAPPHSTQDVVIHPGSGGTKKNWPLENFVELTNRLQSRGRDVSWLLGPAEEGLAVPHNVATLRPESVSEAAQLLAGARLYVGNDSGMSHLAAAVGCSGIALFGPTNPAVWRPLGKGMRMLRGSPFPTLEEAWDAL